MSTSTDRRARVQADHDGKPAGTVSWDEHVQAWEAFNDWIYHGDRNTGLSAEFINERGGFRYAELAGFLDHEPFTWKPNT